MTQQLLDLFIEYNIPSDLLSFDGDGAANSEERIDNVKVDAQTNLAPK